MTRTGRAMLVVDVQNDFCEGGSLAVTGGAAVAAGITRWVHDHRDDYDVVVATADWHEDPGSHWAAEPDYRDTWPVHCEAGQHGAAFHTNLDVAPDTVVRKGQHEAAYSGFEGRTEDGRTLQQVLRDAAITSVDIAGIATDHCVLATALDAIHAGFLTRVLINLTAGVLPDTTKAAVDEMQRAGVEIADAIEAR